MKRTLTRDINDAQGINALLEVFGVYVDADMATFAKQYLDALMLDLELAQTRGDSLQAELGIMIQELLEDMRQRVEEAIALRSKAVAALRDPPRGNCY